VNSQPQLIRGLGLVDATSIVVGTIIGTGIFLVPSSISQQVGSVGLVYAVWIFAGLLSLAGALSYAELGAAIPEAGGEYAFLRRAYGPMWGYMYGWEAFVIGKTGSVATIAAAFARFLGIFFEGLQEPFIQLPLGFTTWSVTGGQAISIGAIVLLTVINYLGVVLGGHVQTIFTVLKVAIIGGLAVLAFVIGNGQWSNFTPFFAAPKGIGTLSALGVALIGALWAYDGWNNLTMVSAEIKNPEKNIPRALIFGTGGVMLVYLFINAAYFYILPIEAVQGSERVAQDMAEAFLGDWGVNLITLGALISTFATLNAAILSGARIPYAMARDGLFFRFTSAVHPAHRTPSKALLLQGGIACLIALLFPTFEGSFTYTIFGLWIFYGITTASVFVLRWKEPDLVRPYKTLGYPWVPGIFVAVAAIFTVNTLLTQTKEAGLGLLFIAAGLPFYWWWKKKANSS
jgi:amino acid transporter